MLNELICYAENKANEAAEQNKDVAIICYWTGYRDGLLALKNKMGGNTNA